MNDLLNFQEMARAMMIPIEDIGFSVRTHNRLLGNGIFCIGDLCKKTETQLLKLKGFGRKCLREVAECLNEYNLSLGIQLPDCDTKKNDELIDAFVGKAKRDEIAKEGYGVIPVHLRKIEDLNLSIRSYTCLKNNKIDLIGDLTQKSEAILLDLRNFGRKSLREIKAKLSELDLSLGMNIKDWNGIDHDELLETYTSLVEKDKDDQKNKIINYFQKKFKFLEDELAYIADYLIRNNRNSEIVINCLGWTGQPPRTLESVGYQFDITRERVRQIITLFYRRIHGNKNKNIYFLKFEKCFKILEKRVPIRADLLEQELLEKGLVKDIFRVESILNFYKKFGKDNRFYIFELNKTRFIVDKSYYKALRTVINLSKRKVSHYGIAKINDIALEIEGLIKKPVSNKFVESVASLLNGFKYLDKANGWFWLSKGSRNRVLNYSKKILSVAKDIDVSELRAGISKHHRMKGCSPPRRVLLELFKQIDWTDVDNNSIILKVQIDYESVLEGNEWLMISILKDYGPILDYYRFRKLCLEYGMNEGSFYAMLSYSPVLIKHAPLIYGIRGSKILPSQVEELRKGHKPKKVLKDFGWTNDGKIWMAHQISAGMLRMGRFTIPSSMQAFIDSTYLLKSDDDVIIGEVKIKDSTGSGLKNFFNRRGGEVGDFMVIELNNSNNEGKIYLGSHELIDQFRPEI